MSSSLDLVNEITEISSNFEEADEEVKLFQHEDAEEINNYSIMNKNNQLKRYRSKSLTDLNNFVLSEIGFNKKFEVVFRPKQKLPNWEEDTNGKTCLLKKDNLRLRLLKMKYKHCSFDSPLKEKEIYTIHNQKNNVVCKELLFDQMYDFLIIFLYNF